jgi:hypothetical protein
MAYSSVPEPGPMLDRAPPDVAAADLSDPFGVYTSQQAAVVPPPPPPDKRGFFAKLFGIGAPVPPASVPLSYAQ